MIVPEWVSLASHSSRSPDFLRNPTPLTGVPHGTDGREDRRPRPGRNTKLGYRDSAAVSRFACLDHGEEIK
jgi:hypothetical protein